MSTWAKSNFSQIADINQESEEPMRGRVEALLARKELGFRELGISRYTYRPDVHDPIGHYHREQEEAYVVVSGSGRIKLDNEITELEPWDVLRVEPQVVRAFESGPDGLELICVGSRVSPDGDYITVDGFWE